MSFAEEEVWNPPAAEFSREPLSTGLDKIRQFKGRVEQRLQQLEAMCNKVMRKPLRGQQKARRDKPAAFRRKVHCK